MRPWLHGPCLVLTALILCSCTIWGGGPREIPGQPDLERSQSLVSRVAKDPAANTYFKDELSRARQDIERAIQIWNDEKGRLDEDDDEWLEIRHLNYMARQRTALVVMKLRGLDAQRELAELQSEYAQALAHVPRPEPENVPAAKPSRLPQSLQVLRPRHEPRGLILTLDQQFLGGGSQVAPAEAAYDALLEYLVANPAKVVSCEGHVGEHGQADVQKLSQQLARQVQDQLLKRGLEFSRVTAVGYGNSRTLAPPGAATGHSRVEIVISDSVPITYDDP